VRDEQQPGGVSHSGHAQELESDQSMVEFLRRDGFSGQRYDAWELKLVRQVMGRLIKSIQTGNVFADARSRRWIQPSTKERLILQRDSHEAESLAGHMIVLLSDSAKKH
jgi:hypothetical protein